MNIPPLVIFGATFLVWITAKGELGKYWGYATVAKAKAAATTTPQQGGLGAPSASNATSMVANGGGVGS